MQETDSDPEWGCLPELSPSRASAKAAGTQARARVASRGRDGRAMLQDEGGEWRRKDGVRPQDGLLTPSHVHMDHTYPDSRSPLPPPHY